MMVIVMIVGILFASHVYYHALGGQGFLKAKRQEEESKENISTQLYLPMRKLETVVQGKSSWGLIGRSPKNIPFYTCGDQLNSCQTFDQPVSCCLLNQYRNSRSSPGHMLPSNHGLLSCEVHTIWYRLLQVNRKPIRLRTVRRQPSNLYRRDCSMFRSNRRRMLPFHIGVLTKWMHTCYQRQHSQHHSNKFRSFRC